MRSFLLLIIFLTIVGVSLSAKANPKTTATETPSTTAIPMRLTAIPKMDMLYVKAMKRIAQTIEENSNKQIRPELFANGQKGSEKEVLQEQIQGNLEGGFTSASTLALQLPAFRVLAIPLLFTKPDQVRTFMGSQLDTALRDMAKTKNLQILGYASYGFYGILSFRPNPSNPSDTQPSWENLTTRIPLNPWMNEIHQALALRPIFVPITDLSSMITTGWVQGITASPEMLSHTPFPTTAAVYFNTYHLHGWSLFTVNLEWFEKLPVDLQNAIKNAVNTVLPQTLEQAFTLEQKLLNQWTTQNHLKIVTPDATKIINHLQAMALKTIQEMETLLNLPNVITSLWQQNVQPIANNPVKTQNFESIPKNSKHINLYSTP